MTFLQVLQPALDDAASMLAVLVMLYAIGSFIYNAAYTRHWWRTTYRRYIYAGAAALRLLTAVAYGAVLFVNPGASVALLRPLFLFTMLACDIITNKMDAIESLSPEGIAEKKIERLNHEMKQRQQEIENLNGLLKAFREQVVEMRRTSEAFERVIAEQEAVIRQKDETIEKARQGAAEYFEKYMAAQTLADQLQESIDRARGIGD